MIAWTSFAIVVVAVLGWNLYRRFGSDRIAALNEQRRTTSRAVGRVVFVDGNRHVAVAVAVTQSTFFYENASMQASIDLQWVREVEYDTELGTGATVNGGRVLRLRTDSQTFEFILPPGSVARWYLMLPPRRSANAGFAGTPVAPLVASAT